MSTTRRDFIRNLTLTSISLAPATNALAGLFTEGQNINTAVFIHKWYRIIEHESLCTLELYFNNVQVERRNGEERLVKLRPKVPSYMIVRLPQQHIAEGYIHEEYLKDDVKQVYALTRISGYSFLVFLIDYEIKMIKDGLPTTSFSFLNWNAQYFRLIVRQNLNERIFRTKIDPDNPLDGFNGPNTENHYPFGYRRQDGKLKFSREYFPVAYRYMHQTPDSSQVKAVSAAPITAIEVPKGLVLTPALPDQDKYIFYWDMNISTVPDTGSCYQREMWMATLTIRPSDKRPTVPQEAIEKLNRPRSDLRENEKDTGDELIQLNMIGYDENLTSVSSETSTGYPCSELPPAPISHNGKSVEVFKDVLPVGKDFQDLVDLYIKYKLSARTSKISFTPLGICTDIGFKNSKFEEIQKGPADITKPDLYEWQQSVSFGRDQAAKVTRIVVEACTGLKMLHIQTTKRATFKGVSMLIYREYLQPLDIEKDYIVYNNEKNVDQYLTANYKANTPFKKIAFVDLKPRQILPPKSRKFPIDEKVCTDNQILAFWAIAPNMQHLEWELNFTDWHGNTIKKTKKLFLLTHLLTDEKYSIPASEQLIVPVKPIDTKTNLLVDFQKFEKDVDAINTSTAVWNNIMTVSEDTALQKTELYRDYLLLALDSIEARVRSVSAKVEDQVIEEFAVFKRNTLELSTESIQLMEEVRGRIKNIYESYRNELGTLSQSIKELDDRIDAILLQFETDYAKLIDNYNDLRDKVAKKVKEIGGKIEAILGNSPAVQQIHETWQQVQALNEKVETLPLLNQELEKEYLRFLSRLPETVKNRFDDALKNQFNDLINCRYKLRELENTLKSKIVFSKSSIGYAVKGVEEDLEKVKEKIKNEFKGKWEDEYEKVRDAYFEETAKVSHLKTDFVVLKNNIRHLKLEGEKRVLDFYHEYACFPQLHTAKVYVDAINDLVKKEIPIKIKFAQDYIVNQTHDLLFNTKNNVSRVFGEVKADAKEIVKGAIREISHEFGGIINPDLAADYLTYLKDVRQQAEGQLGAAKEAGEKVLEEMKRQLDDTETQIRGKIDEFKKEITNTTDEYKRQVRSELQPYINELATARNNLILMGKEAKLNFERNLDFAKMEAKEYFKGLEAKILGAIHLKDILGDGFEMPKLDKKNNKIVYNFITQKLKPVNLGIFSFDNRNGTSKLVAYFERPLDNSGRFTSWTALNNFRVGIFDNRLLIDFDKLQIYSDENTKNKVSVKIGKVGFQKELAFLEALSNNIKVPGTGLSLSITPRAIGVNFNYTLPGISGGALTLTNLKFGVGVKLPLPIGSKSAVQPMIATFGINGPDDKFVVAAGIFGGRGHFVIEATPKFIKGIDAGIDYGGYLGLDLGIAKGEAFLMAGIRYVYKRDDDGETAMEFYAILTCGGSVTVFGFITISVVFMLCLKYQQYQGKSSLYGTASVTYSIKIGFFKKSFSLTFTKRLAGTDAPANSDTSLLPRMQRQDNSILSNKEDVIYADYREDIAEPGTTSLLSLYNAAQWSAYINTFNLTHVC